MPRQQLVIVAAAAGLMPLGLMGSATRFDDPDAYRALALKSRRFGFVGSSCIHPSQIALLNEAFSPTAEQIVEARRLVQAVDEAGADGRGAFTIDGRMIDAPIVARAQVMINIHESIKARETARAETEKSS